ncbi:MULTISPECIES: stalk domain-containing protein [unclassified Paenibacillus]|uniref:stalk domain-containing protein n=1 Tax=unclassified Paenibacillus TaxID=185978 RepID=UPI002782063E|nr:MULTISPECIES: stalk domain-containing protein [unclassified Paenibacillus]MDQ0896303.1 endonuclease YncB(thermonuclease family) [Paenibacillus sp. V4I7]MDQ0913769.1 endonuclease YncB(thermonuclease family) [Paenibacillus sp. V4I5]
MNLKRKILTATLSLGLVFSLAPVVSADSTAPNVFIDGRQISFEVPPTIVDGSTLVPMRKIFEELGSEISWNGDTQTVKAVKGETLITYTIGQKSATKNSEELNLSVPGVIIDGSTMMPLRFVGEALGATVGWEGNSRTVTISSAKKVKTTVSSVVDGDTIKIDWNGKTESIRLIGVDTPETEHPNKPVQEYGKEASEFTKAQLTGKTVYVEVDVDQRDRYGRLLGYVYTEDSVMFNARLVAEGYGQVATFPPNVRWVELFKSLQTSARNNSLGLWQSVDSAPKAVSLGDIVITDVDKVNEVVTISNVGSADINLTGWKVISVTGNQTYTFNSDFILKAGASVKLTSGSDATTTDNNLLWTKSNIWNNTSSDPAELYDNEDTLVSSFE